MRNNAESVQWSKARIPDFPREILVICSISTKEAQKKSYISSTDVLEFCTVPSNPSLKEVFGDDVSSFYRIKRLRFLDHKPAELVTTYIPKYLIENLNDYDLTKNSLFDILEREKNIYVDYAEKLLRAVNVSKKMLQNI